MSSTPAPAHPEDPYDLDFTSLVEGPIDRPAPPPTPEQDEHALIGANALGFTGHPGVKAAIIEDLIMEFEEAPADPGPTLARLREVQTALEDALVPIMTGVVRILRLMD